MTETVPMLWIDVKDGLPDEGDQVVVAHKIRGRDYYWLRDSSLADTNVVVWQHAMYTDKSFWTMDEDRLPIPDAMAWARVAIPERLTKEANVRSVTTTTNENDKS